jgi:hypothetical protein
MHTVSDADWMARRTRQGGSQVIEELGLLPFQLRDAVHECNAHLLREFKGIFEHEAVSCVSAVPKY